MGAAKSGVGVASMGVMRPELVMKSIVPVVMAGFYGLIHQYRPKAKSHYLFDGYAHLSSGLAAGIAIAEALSLHGLIVSIILSSHAGQSRAE
ncbi:hypothetical protein Bca101_022010 [Brassica carinata]